MRRVAPAELPDVVDVLCDAFREYPVMRFILGADRADHDADLHALVHFFAAARVLRKETVLGVGGPGALEAVALISDPQGPPSPPELGELRDRTWARLGDEARARYDAFGAAADPFEVETPHLHLNMIGVRTAAQGQGLARPLIEEVHRISLEDPRSHGVTLTTELPKNVGLYEYFGYRIVGQADVGPGLRTWGFYRPD